MKLLPYAARHELPELAEDILDVIARHISTDKLKHFSPELDNDSVYIKALVEKCHVQEDAIKQANDVMQHMINKHVTEMAKEKKTTPAPCDRHNCTYVKDFKKAKKCRKCLKSYMKYVDAEYFYPKEPTQLSIFGKLSRKEHKEEDLTELLKLTDDIATSLKK